jgi:hypothetical protein
LDQPTLGINIVREVPPPDTVGTFPAGDGAHRIAITSDDTNVVDIDFGNDPVDPIIVDDGDDGFTIVSGEWDVSQCWLFYQQDAHYLCDTTDGQNSIEWAFTGLTPGTAYRVSTTWLAGGNRSVDAPFTISGGAAPTTVIVDQTMPPSSFTANGANWEDLSTSYTITGTTLTVRLTDDHSGGCLIGDAVRIAPVSAAPTVTPPAPSPRASETLRVLDGSTLLLDTLSTIDFGTVDSGDLATRTLVLENPASATSSVTLGEVWFSGSEFALTSSVSGVELAPGEATSIEISMNTTTPGEAVSDLAIFDANGERLLAVVVLGRIEAATVSADGVILDDGDVGFDDGGFNALPNQGREDDLHFSRPTWNQTASWTFSDLPQGAYRVSATWKAQDSLADNAPFTIRDGATILATAEIDQSAAPSDFWAAGSAWEILANPVNVSNGTLVVQLTDIGANGYVVADSVYVERLSPLPEGEASPDTAAAANDLALSQILDELDDI